MMRYLIAAVALLTAAPAIPQSLTLGNLKGPIAERSGQPEARSIKELWAQILSIPPKAATAIPTAGLPKVASGIRIADYLQPAWRTGAIPPTMAPDVVGAFRFSCEPSHNAYDDPIVYPGQPGASHLHTFFGNTKADANSTYASLRSTGDSTCNTVLNRSAYWVASMLDGAGNVVMPDWLTAYYKRAPEGSPECKRAKACLDLPRGLRYVFGYNMQAPAKSDPASKRWWNCDAGPGGHFATIAGALKDCPIGARIGVVMVAPDCWNGVDLDSPDHRSHMAFQVTVAEGMTRCPDTHPYLIPEYTLGEWFTVDETTKGWYLSSDRMPGMAAMEPGTTAHGDWFGAWEDDILSAWIANCINKLLSCTSGDLGDGRQMKMTRGYTFSNGRPRVPMPARL